MFFLVKSWCVKKPKCIECNKRKTSRFFLFPSTSCWRAPASGTKLILSIIFKVKCTTSEDEDENLLPVQTTKISDFFSPKSVSKKPRSLKTTVAVKADKKRKKADIEESKVVTNGSEAAAGSLEEDEKGHKSPPAKKRIEDDEKPSKNGNENAGNATSTGGSSISNFFRPISKSDFIKDSEKRTLTVKAMVHSPSEIRSALKPESSSQEPKESKETVSSGGVDCKPTPPKTTKKRRSKYVAKNKVSSFFVCVCAVGAVKKSLPNFLDC